MTRCRLAGPGATVDGLEPHCPHQAPDTFPVDPVAPLRQPRSYPACPIKWRGQVLTIDQLHKGQVLLTDSDRLVVQAGTTNTQ